MGNKKETTQYYAVFDCSPLPSTLDKGTVARYKEFGEKFNKDNIFYFSKDSHREGNLVKNPFLSSIDGKCWAGRWIGAASIQGKKAGLVNVSPRFGNVSLFAMMEETFSCNIVNSVGGLERSVTFDSIMGLIIGFVWGKKLADANKYGVPHINVDVVSRGISIRGRLDVRKSMFPLFKSREVVSVHREKQIDEVVAQIILQAHKKINPKVLSDNAKNALDNFYSAHYPTRYLAEKDYQSIRYKSIYQAYKDVVDFSWQVLKTKNFTKGESNKCSFSGFVDMAEIWEMYLRSLLKKNFPDWNVVRYEESAINVYGDKFWERNIVPDILLWRNNSKGKRDVVVLDAKWKRMSGNKNDVAHSDLDRDDFFQIHSYIGYFQALGDNVVAGGLLYPLDESFITNESRFANLWGFDNHAKFFVDGIKIPSGTKNNEAERLNIEEYKKYKGVFEKNEEEFINRMKELIGGAS